MDSAVPVPLSDGNPAPLSTKRSSLAGISERIRLMISAELTMRTSSLVMPKRHPTSSPLRRAGG